MTHKLFRENFIIDSLIKIFGFTWNDEGVVSFLEKDGKEFSADDYMFLPIPNTGLCTEDGKFVCDGILFFGDGTTEFHDIETLDAYNWEDCDEESLCKVEDILRKRLERKAD